VFRRQFTKKRALVAGVVAALAVATGAFAYFTSTGSGTGSGSVGSASNWTVEVTSDSSEAIFPGAGSETLTYTITNAGKGHQNLEHTSVAVAAKGGNITEKGVEVAGCKASWFKAVNTPPALPHDLASGEKVTGTVTVSMEDASENQNACQTKKPEVNVEAS
jgi:archaellum component FlaG (FlaF/FlaG flagellin family)